MRSEHLVVDSSAFLRLVDLKHIGNKIYTCPDVVAEIKDRRTRRNLSILPYELVLEKPSANAVNKIIQISKVTGDYLSLSHTDIQVLALTYQLSCKFEEKCYDAVSVSADTIQLGGSVKEDLSILGFYIPNKNNGGSSSESLDACCLGNEEKNRNFLIHDETNVDVKDLDDDEWITPAILRDMNGLNCRDDHSVKVACITRDFAMQNVLKKMNLSIMAIDGMMIKSVRSHVLRCHACFEVTRILTKKFCPKCGNKTLKRVPVELNEDGSLKMFFSKNPKVLNPKGLQCTIPHPRGGKHANNPILVEDQRIPHNRLSRKAKMKTDVWAEGYECSESPFVMRDVESRAFRLGIRPSTYRKTSTHGTRFVNRK